MTNRTRFNIESGYGRGLVVVLKFKDAPAATEFMKWLDEGKGKKNKEDLGWD